MMARYTCTYQYQYFCGFTKRDLDIFDKNSVLKRKLSDSVLLYLNRLRNPLKSTNPIDAYTQFSFAYRFNRTCRSNTHTRACYSASAI